MNKLVKGSIAAAAGIALLLGGAGSLALWNDEATVNAGTVNSGTLQFTSGGGAWSEDIDFIVPGDSLTYTAEYSILAIGDNLDAELSSNIAGLVNDITGSTADTTFTVTDSDDNVLTPVGGVYSFGEGSYVVEVLITVDFPASSEFGQGATLDLGTVTVSLDQV